MIRKLITIFVIIIIYSNIYSASYEEIHEHNLQFIKNLNVDEIENLKKFTLETYEREIKEIENFTQKINSLQDEIKIYAESYDYEIDYYYYEFKLEEFEIDKHIDVLESTENDIFSEHMLPYLLKNKINTINDTKREIKNTTKQDFLHIKNSIHWDYYSWLGMNSNN